MPHARALLPYLLALVSAGTLGAQDAAEPEQIGPDEIRTLPALVSVDRKHARGSDIGLYLCEADGRMIRIWEGEPYDARALLDRTVLVADRRGGRIAWIERDGTVLFERSGLRGPVDIERALDGTIVVVVNDANEIIGIDPESGRIVWRRGGFNDPFDVDVLEDGGLLVADSGAGRVVELDPEGNVRFERRGLGFPNTVERFEAANGEARTLVTRWSAGEVLELDHEGRTRWRVDVGGTVYRAERRMDGLTLVCDGSRGLLQYVSRSGLVLKTERFKPGCVDYETIREL